MILDRVTMTGAADDTSIDELIALSKKYPFVEWGVLISKNNFSKPRYPTAHWISQFQAALATESEKGHEMKAALHVCGSWVRNLLMGKVEIDTAYFERFQRIQLNFHAEKCECNIGDFHKALYDIVDPNKEGTMPKQFIFQLDGAKGNVHLEDLYKSIVMRGLLVNAVPLFDKSGGAGVLPKAWPSPAFSAAGQQTQASLFHATDARAHDTEYMYYGYAGGLGPDNLAEQLPLIDAAAGKDTRIWIDMETKVRSRADRVFDLYKVEEALKICEPFIAK